MKDTDVCRCYLPMPCSYLGRCRKCRRLLPPMPRSHRRDMCPYEKYNLMLDRCAW